MFFIAFSTLASHFVLNFTNINKRALTYPRTDVIISTITPPTNNRAASEVKQKIVGRNEEFVSMNQIEILKSEKCGNACGYILL